MNIEDQIREIIPSASFERDNDGQLVVYTDIYPEAEGEQVDYEVTYPLGFLVRVPANASKGDIIDAYMECVEDWVQDGAMPATEHVEIKRVELP